MREKKLTNSFWGNIFRGRHRKDEEILGVLKKVPIFETLSHRELSSIELILHRREYREDEVIFRQNDPAVGMYIVIRGTVSIVAAPSDNVLAELHDGEFFGELALLDDSPRSATAVAMTPCSLLGFFQPDLFGLTERNPRLGIKIVSRLARVIGERLKKTNEQLQAVEEELQRIRPEEHG